MCFWNVGRVKFVMVVGRLNKLEIFFLNSSGVIIEGEYVLENVFRILN